MVRDAAVSDRPLAVDFRFDAWGGKYPPWTRDAAVSRQIARLGEFERAEADFVLEGGSVDGNGCGAVLTTESCLLHPNREAGRSRDLMEPLDAKEIQHHIEAFYDHGADRHSRVWALLMYAKWKESTRAAA